VSRNPIYPTLAGQYADYLLLQLQLFKSKQRGCADYADIMCRVAAGLNQGQMRDVANYYAALSSAQTQSSLALSREVD
jgi:cytochrome c553